MAPLSFTPSGRGTLGLEWELFVTDAATGGLAPRASDLLDAVGAVPDGPIVGEYLTTMVELVSGVHATVEDAVGELAGHLRRLSEAAHARGLAVLAAGSHPFATASDAPVKRSEQYDVVAERNAWWGRQMLICGVHVHVGVPDRDWALPLTHFLAERAPILLALSASSPFFAGEDTGFASQRTMLFQQLPTNGLPPAVHDWPAFERYAADLQRAGMVRRATEIRWDVRPAPRFGTVEVRVADATPTLDELACVGAWAQCLTEWFYRQLDAGARPEPLAPWFVRENKWRAARYGLDAAVIPAGPGEPVALRDEIGRWLGDLAPVAAELGCTDALAVTTRLLASGTSAERQRARAASGADLATLTRALVAETAASLRTHFPAALRTGDPAGALDASR